MSDGDILIKEAEGWAPIVPRLLVSDLDRSVGVYTRLLGFTLEHTEPPRLAVLRLGTGQIVLQQFRPNDPLVVAELTAPFGRGVTLHLRTGQLKPIYEGLRAEKYPVLVPMEVAELEEGGEKLTETSFVIQDPDGYLLRFSD